MKRITKGYECDVYIGAKDEIMSFARTLGELTQTYVKRFKWQRGVCIKYDHPTLIRVTRDGVYVADVMMDAHDEPTCIILNK